MKNRIVLSVIVLILASGFAPMPQEPAGGVLDNILVIAGQFTALAGISALVAVLVNVAYRVGIIKDDYTASQVTNTLNLIAFVALVAFGIFRPDLSLAWLDAYAAKITALALFVLGLLTQITVPAPVNNLLYRAQVPVLGVRPDNTVLPQRVK